MALKLEYTPAEFVAELDRQAAQAQELANGLGEPALNWQPKGGKGWSILQCLDHLAIMNAKYVKALQDAVASNEDQLEPRKNAHPALGMVHALVRWHGGASAEDQAAGSAEDLATV